MKQFEKEESLFVAQLMSIITSSVTCAMGSRVGLILLHLKKKRGGYKQRGSVYMLPGIKTKESFISACKITNYVSNCKVAHVAKTSKCREEVQKSAACGWKMV